MPQGLKPFTIGALIGSVITLITLSLVNVAYLGAALNLICGFIIAFAFAIFSPWTDKLRDMIHGTKKEKKDEKLVYRKTYEVTTTSSEHGEMMRTSEVTEQTVSGSTATVKQISPSEVEFTVPQYLIDMVKQTLKKDKGNETPQQGGDENH